MSICECEVRLKEPKICTSIDENCPSWAHLGSPLLGLELGFGSETYWSDYQVAARRLLLTHKGLRCASEKQKTVADQHRGLKDNFQNLWVCFGTRKRNRSPLRFWKHLWSLQFSANWHPRLLSDGWQGSECNIFRDRKELFQDRERKRKERRIIPLLDIVKLEVLIGFLFQIVCLFLFFGGETKRPPQLKGKGGL